MTTLSGFCHQDVQEVRTADAGSGLSFWRRQGILAWLTSPLHLLAKRWGGGLHVGAL